MSPLVISKILGVSVNTLSANNRYSVCSRENLPQTVQMQLSKKLKLFFNLLLNFGIIHQILNILKKKMIIIACVFLKL